ncbi:MAG: family efflux transporter [Chitinophagaceae bacterium]|nr:family efflux transporter [Chitinophagaceae bacterium]
MRQFTTVYLLFKSLSVNSFICLCLQPFMSIAIDKSLQVKITNRQILKIALPISVALIIPNINFITNNVFLGGLGERELGNAGTVGVFYLILMISGNGLSNALQVLISRHGGEGNTVAISKVFAQGIRIALQFALAGMLLTWFIAPLCLKPFIKAENFQMEMEFLRIRVWGLPFLYLFQCGNSFLIATLNSKYMMIGMIGEALINIFFDYVLIYGALSFPQLGFNGAAVASVIAEFTGMSIVYIVIFKQGLKKKFNLFSDFSYHKTTSKSILKISAPLVGQFAISLTTWLIFFILLESYGERAKAISNTMRNVFGFVGIFMWAFASTTNTMVSNLIGQGLQSKVIMLIKKIMVLNISAAFIMLGILNLFPQHFLKWFGQDAAFIHDAVPVIRIVSLGMLMMSIAVIWLNAVTGTGKTKMNLLIELIAIICYLIYIYLVMIKFKLSLEWAWANELIYWMAIFAIAFWYIKSGRWKQKIV